jgi:hypothetical protein
MLAPIEDIFCEIDDFCKDFYQKQSQCILPNPYRKRIRYCKMSSSEIITILALFHLSHYRTFKDYYHECVIKYLKPYFPSLVSYNRFLELKSSVIMILAVYMKHKAGSETGIYYIDSTTLKVCRNQRIYRHKVFDKIAKRGKSSMGWFFGFKLHLVINHKGEIMSFCLTPGNVDDRAPMESLFKNLKGTACGDKGYISKSKTQALFETGLNFVTKIKANMKKIVRSNFEKYILAQRAIIETVIEQLKSICLIEHSRHRKPDNFLANTLSALIAYTIKPRKPSINQRFLMDNMDALTPS